MSTREYMAAKLREFRKASGMSVIEVGKAVGKSDKTISAWEVGRGQPDADMLVRLCQLYSVDISDFYHEPNETLILTQDEERLITAYRALDDVRQSTRLFIQLNDDYRSMAIGYMQGLLSTQNQREL